MACSNPTIAAVGEPPITNNLWDFYTWAYNFYYAVCSAISSITSSASSVPTGIIIPYGGTVAPTGYLMCYGQAVSRVDYANLFAVIGTAYGSGDGVTTFNLPDERGRLDMGKNNMGGSSSATIANATANTLGGTFGQETKAMVAAENGPHSHTVTLAAIVYQPGSNQNVAQWNTGSLATSSSGSGTPFSLINPVIVHNKIIKI